MLERFNDVKWILSTRLVHHINFSLYPARKQIYYFFQIILFYYTQWFACSFLIQSDTPYSSFIWQILFQFGDHITISNKLFFWVWTFFRSFFIAQKYIFIIFQHSTHKLNIYFYIYLLIFVEFLSDFLVFLINKIQNIFPTLRVNAKWETLQTKKWYRLRNCFVLLGSFFLYTLSFRWRYKMDE